MQLEADAGQAYPAVPASPDAFQSGLRRHSSSSGGSTPSARIAARISSPYSRGFAWPNCDGGTKPIRNAATDDAAPSAHCRPSAGALYPRGWSGCLRRSLLAAMNNSAYWIFAAMATQVYLIMYGLMFIAAIRLRRRQPDHPRGYRAPALGLQCALGAASSVAAFLIGFVPPSQFGHANPLLYGLLILAAILALGVLPPLLLEWRRKPDWKASGEAGTAG